MRPTLRLHALAASVLALLPATVLAAAPAAAPATSVGVSQFAQVFGALILILGLIFGLGFFAQRLRLGRGASGRHLRIVDALALGTRERLLLVDVAGERVLLGVAAGRIERLHVLPPGAAAEIDAPVAPAPSFPGVLAAVLGRRDAS